MACDEFSKAIDWYKSGGATEQHHVVVYFTKHFGYGESLPEHQDSVHYVTGQLLVDNNPKPHLYGNGLPVFNNSGKNGQMVKSSDLSYDLKIFPEGTVS